MEVPVQSAVVHWHHLLKDEIDVIHLFLFSKNDHLKSSHLPPQVVHLITAVRRAYST